ncbi:MAG TPA: sugar transferase [Ktedonobacteraceae bacterium]|jgi:lipopolysaccharide/colanic/teichoic acid biosynthesis glycosyltransferase|nr:sugar transferase [Ktedonobacteraceae bacterium]
MDQIMVTMPKRQEEGPVSQKALGMSPGILNTDAITVVKPGVTITGEPAALYHIFKRVCDIVLSLIGIIVLMPVLLLIAVCIKLDDRGSVLHFREIIGYQGRRFYALKFRTMIPDADTYLAKHPELMRKFQQNMKLERDPRITRVGRFLRKTSLDELPQLFNVLVGQMSLVGPRMIHPSELPRYGEYAQKRLSVKPGITGLWQISGRQHISYDERVLLDMQYIDTRSFIVDLAILVKTLKVFIVHTGA